MLNSNGFSLTEVMIASAVLVTAAVLLSSNNQLYVSQGYNMRRACDTHAQSVISAVQEETYYRMIEDDMTTGAVPRLPGNIFTPTRAIPAANINWYWQLNGAPDPIYGTTAPGVVGNEATLHSGLLIQGSLRSLSAIYNNFAPVRCAFGSYPPLTTGLPISQALMDSAATVTMMLEPYDASTGASLCGAAPGAVYPVPRAQAPGNNESDAFAAGAGTYSAVDWSKDISANGTNTEVPDDILDSTGPGTKAIAKTNFGLTPNLGIRMHVQVNYTYKSQPGTCTASQKFEYPNDRDPPPRPNLMEVYNNTSVPGGPNALRDYCGGGAAVSTGSVDIDIGYESTPTEGGIQFLCMDQSWIRQPDPAATSMVACRDSADNPIAGATVPQRTALPVDPTFFSDKGFPYPYTPDFSQRAGVWQPCDLLRQCGQLPTSTSTSVSSPDLNLTNHYDNLPAGCVLNFEVVAVDTAGNRSGTRSLRNSKAYLEDPTGAGPVPEPTTSALGGGITEFTAYDDEIYYPNCTGSAAVSAYYRQGLGNLCTGGYYKCDGGC